MLQRFFCALTAAIAATPLSACYNEARDYQGLMQRAQTVQGEVYSLNCRQHGEYWYKFSFDGKQHIGKSEQLYAPTNCNGLKKGDAVTVYVDPLHPDVHTLAAPSKVYEGERGFYIPPWALVMFGPLLLVLPEVWRATRPKEMHKE